MIKAGIIGSTGYAGQELVRILLQHGEVEIKYTIIKETGPDHDKTFEAQVECNHKKLAEGTWKSKKLAEMEAARKALQNIK